MAAPAMPMVGHSGSTGEATGDDTPRLRSATRIATGKVALLDDVEKPTMIASAMPRKKGSGGSQASNRTTMPPWMTSVTQVEPTTTQSASLSTARKLAGPVDPITTAISAKTPKDRKSVV